MMPKNKPEHPYSVAFVTVPDEKSGRELANGILQSRFAACVNILPGMTSLYWWEEKIEEAKECLLVIKTRTNLMPELIAFVRSQHSYSIPEVISWQISAGNEDYLTWLGANTMFVRGSGRPMASNKPSGVDPKKFS